MCPSHSKATDVVAGYVTLASTLLSRPPACGGGCGGVVVVMVGGCRSVGLKAGHWDKWWDKGQERALIMTTVELGRVCR